MRNVLALIAAFTLSSSTGVSVVACGNSDNTTTKIFDWNSVINGKNGETSDDFFDQLLNDPDSGIGQTLYQDIVDYVSLSILKTNSAFASDYAFAKQSVENQIQNIQDSLKAKYGKSWGSKWSDFLKQPAQGGDGKTGSYQRYFDTLLKSKATTIVNNYYVSDNYHDYQYYNTSEINIWLNDIYNFMYNGGGHIRTLDDYINSGGAYASDVWIVSFAYSGKVGQESALDQAIQNLITNKAPVTNIPLEYKVPVTTDNKAPDASNPTTYVSDPTATIKGLLSNQQQKIAQVWMKNQGPIWARQIVIPFNQNVKSQALQTEIKSSDFSDSNATLTEVLNNISTKGFDYALQSLGDITQASDSSATGDLGLVTLNSDSSKIKSSFAYYLYRYVTSEQGIGNDGLGVQPYNISQFNIDSSVSSSTINNLVSALNRTYATSPASSSSQFNDMVWISDPGTNNNDYSGNGGNKIFAFIDADGIHFVQTPGIAYKPTMTVGTPQGLVTNFSQQLSEGNKITWNQAAQVVNRPGGLSSNPYLSYLETQYLYWQSNNQTSYFDLNSSLSSFTAGSSDITSSTWWDYILFFNNNQDKINWHLNSNGMTDLLGDQINASTDNISNFVLDMKSWFTTTANRRLSLEQSNITNLSTLVQNIDSLNNTWNGYKNQSDVPPARMDSSSIKDYINRVANETIWWYDPNNIYN